MDDLKRPIGVAPGSLEWLRSIEGPRLLQRLVEEVHASPVGDMTPTQARCASMLIPITYPALSAVHHTVESSLSKLSTEELTKRLKEIIKEDHTLQLHMDSRDAVTVEFKEGSSDAQANLTR